MKNNKLLIAIIVCLVLLNLLLIGFILSKPGMPGKGKPDDARLQKMFDFSNDQMAEFKKVKAIHIKEMETLLKSLNDKSNQYYDLSISNSKDELLKEISVIDQQIYIQNLKHFEDIKAICNDDQMDALDKFIKILLHKNKGRKPPKKR